MSASEWAYNKNPHLDEYEIRRLFLLLLAELGLGVESRQVEEDIGPRIFSYTEYRIARRKV
jgi:hypothetical protein